MSSLFDKNKKDSQPLSFRMRPRCIEEFVGQSDIIDSLILFFKSISETYIPSCIFSGPPGCGKTTLATMFSHYSKSVFVTINAAFSTLSELKTLLDEANSRSKLYGKHTIIFVDEAHRLTRQSQDALLPFVEDGTISFVAATTENPYYAITNALRSRSRIFTLKSLERDDIKKIITFCLKDNERGLGKYDITLESGCIDDIVLYSQGDARGALNILEDAFNIASIAAVNGKILIDKKIIEKSLSEKKLNYDKNGNMHYQLTSAFIKSIRGSDPDAALFYLFAMLERGGDPLFIFRRMLILSAEDVGLADPNAISVVNSCRQAFEQVGMPEGEYHLSFAALYLSLTHKSNSVGAFHKVKEIIKTQFAVPGYLVNTNPEIAKYKYPHDFYYHFSPDQDYFPQGFKDYKFYNPGFLGFEKKLAEIHAYRQSLKANCSSPQSKKAQNVNINDRDVDNSNKQD